MRVSSIGSTGAPGPTSMTHFEISNGCWEKKHAELQGLCLKICDFIEKNPNIAQKVVITKDIIRGFV